MRYPPPYHGRKKMQMGIHGLPENLGEALKAMKCDQMLAENLFWKRLFIPLCKGKEKGMEKLSGTDYPMGTFSISVPNLIISETVHECDYRSVA